MLWVLLIIFLTGIDQLSKWYFYTNRFQYDGFVVIKDFFYLTYLENRGGIRGFTEFQVGIYYSYNCSCQYYDLVFY